MLRANGLLMTGTSSKPAVNLGNEEHSRQGRLLTLVGYSAGVVVGVGAFAGALAAFLRFGLGPIEALAPDPDAPIQWWHSGFYGSAAALLAFAGFLAQRGRTTASTVVLLGTMDVLLVIQALISDAVAVFALALATPALVATIILGVRETVVHNAFAAALGIALIVRADVPIQQFWSSIVMLVVLLVLVGIISLLRERDLADVVRLRRIERQEAERIQSELGLARRVQLAMLPDQLPDVDGAALAAVSEPAAEASGDLYDLFRVRRSGKSDLVAVAVCDVAGHGIASALVMSATRAALRSAAVRERSPAAVLAEVNDILAASIPPELFVTASYGLFDPDASTFTHSSAGHPHPLLWRPSTLDAIELENAGVPLGLVAGAEYEDCESTLEPGSVLSVYSDGIAEALNREREMYGFDAHIEQFGEACRQGGGPDSILQSMLTSVREFTDGLPLDDDVTVVVLAHTES